MKLHRPNIISDPMYRLLRDGKIKDFNEKKATGQKCEFAGSDLRGIDLRGINADGVNFQDCYFRNADLRGIDFRNSNLEGASLNSANISGCYFPPELKPEEITMSVKFGTRMRYKNLHKP